MTAGSDEARLVRITSNSSLQNSFHNLRSALVSIDSRREADTLQHVLELIQNHPENGGLGLDSSSRSCPWSLTSENLQDVLFLLRAWLEALDSADNSRHLPNPVTARDPERRPMTLSEKIFAHHAIRVPSRAGVQPGDLIRVSVDWVISSEVWWMVCFFVARLLASSISNCGTSGNEK